jgi:hypothetical protein
MEKRMGTTDGSTAVDESGRRLRGRPLARCGGPGRAAGWLGGMALALASARALAAFPAEPSAERPDAVESSPAGDAAAAAEGLRVVVDGSIDDAALLSGWIAERHPGVAEALRGVEGVRTQWIVVQISGSTYDYQVSVTALREGVPLLPPAEPTRCECTTEELLALVDDGITAAVATLRTPLSREPEPRLERAPVEPAIRPSLSPPATTIERAPPDAPAGRLGTIGHAGIGVGVLGAGLAIAGLTLALRPEQARGAPGQVETRDFRTAGIVVGTSGGVVLATGLALLVVDVVVPRERTTAVVPAVGPGHVGVGVMRRF